MKKIILCFICFIVMGYLHAQDNEITPFLSEDDITAVETVLPEDSSFVFEEETPIFSSQAGTANEMSRIKSPQPLFHLLVLDRRDNPGSDIGGIGNMRLLYKYLDSYNGDRGYIIALYVSPAEGPVFPQLPDNSSIMVNISTVLAYTLKEYIDTNAFRRFVTHPDILAQLHEALNNY